MLECIIIKMYIHNKKSYYLVSKEDYLSYKNGSGLLPFIVAMKYKKYLIQHIKENKEKYKNIKLVKEG